MHNIPLTLNLYVLPKDSTKIVLPAHACYWKLLISPSHLHQRQDIRNIERFNHLLNRDTMSGNMFFSTGHYWIECARETKCLTKRKLLQDQNCLSSPKKLNYQGNLTNQSKPMTADEAMENHRNKGMERDLWTWTTLFWFLLVCLTAFF